MATNADTCRHRSKVKYGPLWFGNYECNMALKGRKWAAKKTVCNACDGPMWEDAHNCIYFKIGTDKPYTDKNTVTVKGYCYRILKEEKDFRNEIRDLGACSPGNPDCKPWFIPRPIPEPPVLPPPQAIPIKVPPLKTFIFKTSKFLRGRGGLVIDLINAFPLVIKVLVIVIILLFVYGSLLSHVLNPKNKKIEQLLQDAERSFNSGSYEESITSYDEVLRLDPNNRSASEGLRNAEIRLGLQKAENLYNSGNYKESIRGYVEVLNLDPNNRSALEGLDRIRIVNAKLRLGLQEADKFYKLGKYNEAITAYEDILKLDPNNQKALEGLRNSRISMRSQKANDLNMPETVRQALDGGRKCFDDGNYGCAGRMFNVVLNADHTNNEAIEGRSNSIRLLLQEADRLYNDGNYDMAKKAYEDVLTIDPDNGSAKEGIKRLSIRWMLQEANKHNSLGNYKDAIEWYIKVLSNDPHNQEAKDGKSRAVSLISGIQEEENLNNSGNHKESIETNNIEGMIFIKGGCFDMGDTFGDGDSDERPIHNVCVDNFYMGETEVTQGKWEEMMGNNPSSFKGCNNCPVENVSFSDVKEFIRRLNQRTGKNYRIPTEAEWEYAARSGGKKEKYAGTSNESELVDYAWYVNNSGGRTRPVKQKKANDLGLYDMSGNVWEWVSDWYDSGYYTNGPKDNPKGPLSGTSRVIRGGSSVSSARDTRSEYRRTYDPDYRNDYSGFRLAHSSSTR